MAYIDTGLMPWQPNFSLSVEGADITDVVRENLVDLSLKDHGAGSKKSDEIRFTVVSPGMKLPPKGVKISLALGFGGTLVNKGTFVVDARSSAGGAKKARTIQIVARAFSKTNERGHSTLQSQKMRTFSDISLGDLANTLASEHGLTARVDSTLVNMQLGHVDQVGESDMNLMTRIAQSCGAVSKITHDYWVVTPRDAETTVSGAPLPVRKITPDMCEDWSYHDNSDHPNTKEKGKGTYVVAYRDATDGGKIKHVTNGSGEPVMHFDVPFNSLAEAKTVGAGGSKHAQKKLKGVSLSLPAAPELMGMTAEGKIQLEGFGSVEDGEWKIGQLEFKLQPGQGMTLSMELE
ncbi:phage late control D family protein [Klebsiella aerogenes]|uniref:phage late control D family protein n=1 Tax=Klebsiella aerogenes TaxID=548 RepID=UPI001F1747BC|nr:contractile injection system protein, VgrG/Pvc8 family [Klebsiella aerogenes]